MHIVHHARHPIVLSHFNKNWNVPTEFNKVSKHDHENTSTVLEM